MLLVHSPLQPLCRKFSRRQGSAKIDCVAYVYGLASWSSVLGCWEHFWNFLFRLVERDCVGSGDASNALLLCTVRLAFEQGVQDPSYSAQHTFLS